MPIDNEKTEKLLNAVSALINEAKPSTAEVILVCEMIKLSYVSASQNNSTPLNEYPWNLLF